MSTLQIVYTFLWLAIAGCSRRPTENRDSSISPTVEEQLQRQEQAATIIQSYYRRRSVERKSPSLNFIGELNRILRTANNSTKNLALAEAFEKYKELWETDRRIGELHEGLICLPACIEKIEGIQNELKVILASEEDQLGQLEQAEEYLKDLKKVRTKEIHSSVGEEVKEHIQKKFPYVEQILSNNNAKAIKSLKKKKKKLSETIIRHKREISYMLSLSQNKEDSNAKQVLSAPQEENQRIDEIHRIIKDLKKKPSRKMKSGRGKKKRIVVNKGKKLDTIKEVIDER